MTVSFKVLEVRLPVIHLGHTVFCPCSMRPIFKPLLDEDMDGEAVCTALASCPGPDCLKDIVKKCGPRLRVYKALRAACLESEVS